MAKTLMGAIIKPGGQITATYQYTAFGATKVAVKDANWGDTTKAAAAALLAACDSDLGAIADVQIYTAITDPVGYPGFSAPGECVDINYAPNNTPRSIRIGDDEAVPEPIAEARDALKALIEGAL